EFVGLNHLERFDVDSLLGLTADRQVTETEAEAMRKVLIARYHRDGYAFCSVTVDVRPVPDLPAAAAPAAPGPRQTRPDHYVRFVVDEGPKVTVGTVTFIGNATFPAD